LDFISILSIFVLACFVGYYVVWSVTPALQTPLMAVTNAISSVIIVRALLAAAGCKSLDITNPNDPDGERALSDPQSLEAFVSGSVQSWFNTYEGLTATGPLVTQAQTYSASWNNFNMNFYSGIDAPYTPGANRNSRPWQNDPNASGRTSIEWYWAG